jgi:uncharacterized protein (TIGR04255 family)
LAFIAFQTKIMSETQFEKFPHPPIKEAVFILNLQKTINIQKIKTLSKDTELKKKYPISQISIQNNLRIDTREEAPSTSIEKLQDGLIFRTSEKAPEWVLQVRRSSILLHKVGNYSSWVHLTDEFKEVSHILTRNFEKELQVKEIGIRYINHIPISESQSLQKWFKLLPQTVEGVPANLHKFLLQLGVEKEDISGLIIESVLKINSILNFVIDLRATKPVNIVNIEFDNMKKHLDQIRLFKNQLFFNIITDELKTLFR